jgi:hypothetical protein
MNLNKKSVFLLISMMLLIGQHLSAGEAVTFSAEAPRSVVMGQQFNIVYTSNNEIDNFRMPEIDNFEILMGPSTSTMSSTTIINGKYSSSTTYNYTYVLNPKSTGTFTISPATATIKKDTYKSNGLTIKVLPADQNHGSSSGGSQNRGSSGQGSVQNISSDQIFIRAIPSKTSVYEQEGITMTYKLYTKVDLSGFENPKFPEFKGFMAQEVEVSNNQQWNLENYNGSNYRTALLKQTVLYPQETGNLTIDKGSFDVIMRLRVSNPRMRSIFDDFLDSYQDVKKTIYSNPVKIQVRPLPFGKPTDFFRFAGTLKMNSSISSNQVKTNDAVSVKLIITGNGNLKMIPTPEIKFPQDFEVYDPKVTNSFVNTSKGVTGSKTIEYLAIPRYSGTFEIPSVSISYFDLASNSYKTLKTETFKLSVAKGEGGENQIVSGNFTNKEQLRMLGSDIRYIKTDFKFSGKPELIFGKTWFWIFYILLLVFFFVFLILNRKKAKENLDISRMRNKKANKVAVKRLKKASAYLKEGNKEAFYDEVLKALWGYTSDKLNIPMSRLSKETVDSELSAFNVNEDIRKEYSDILQTCEYARYAPASDSHAMDELYERTMDVMNKMENTIKK